MSAELFGFKGKAKQKGQTTSTGARHPLQSQIPLFEILGRNLLGEQLALPEIPVTTPLQQSISARQDVAQGLLNQAFGQQPGLAGRLAGQGPQPTIEAAPGVPQFGRTQTREELGMPRRREMFPFTPTPEEYEESIGVPPLRRPERAKKAERKEKRLEARKGRLEERIERREAKGKQVGKAERRLARTEAKIKRVTL